MGAGEYVSMKVQREVYEQLIHEEAHGPATMPEEEHHELIQIHMRPGVDQEVADQLPCAVMKDPRLAVETRARGAPDRMHEGPGNPVDGGRLVVPGCPRS